jgi:hypothetical protein
MWHERTWTGLIEAGMNIRRASDMLAGAARASAGDVAPVERAAYTR